MKKKLLLHACCAPCLTSVDERLTDLYDLDVFWFNPNIQPINEELKRLEELKKYTSLIRRELIIQNSTERDRQNWEDRVVDYQNEPEGQRRCRECIFFRMQMVAEFAKKEGYELFATTLTVSPRKSSLIVNTAGKMLSEKLEVPFLEADFKKQDGYLRSIQLSKEYDLYRQNYCGCRFSLKNN